MERMARRWNGKSARGTIGLLAACTLAACGLVHAEAAQAALEGESVVTSVQGEATAGGERLGPRSEVPAERVVATGPGASCSVLVDPVTVVQFCGETSLVLRADPVGRKRIVEVERGSTKAVVGPRTADEPFEIHTPAAIALILGTIVSTDIDPVTGATTFSVEEGQVRVQSSDPSVPGSVTVRAGEAVSVARGRPPGQVREVRSARLAGTVECLADALFHVSAVRTNRAERERAVTATIVAPDIVDDLPPVAAAPEPVVEPPPSENPVVDIPIQPCQLDPTACGEVRELPPAIVVPPLPVCADIPGEHCSF